MRARARVYLASALAVPANLFITVRGPAAGDYGFPQKGETGCDDPLTENGTTARTYMGIYAHVKYGVYYTHPVSGSLFSYNYMRRVI